MRRVKPPLFDDAALQTKISGAKQWATHLPAWQQAYVDYTAAKGNAWKLKALVTVPSIADELYDLYDAKSQTNDFLTQRDALVGACPMCGSDSTSDLDHLVPRKSFPEFSVFSQNLVPTCGYCNRGVKKQIVKGATASEYFLHPYFDSLLSKRLWRATFKAPFEAVIFGWEALPSLSKIQRERVAFHLNSVLGKGFRKALGGYWRKHISFLAKSSQSFPNRQIPIADVTRITEDRLGYAEGDRQFNCWEAGLMRGLLADPQALAWIAEKARVKRLAKYDKI